MSHQAFILTNRLYVGDFSPDMADRVHLSGLKPPTYTKFTTPTGCVRNQITLIYPLYNPLIS
jgi:hypothetical protein